MNLKWILKMLDDFAYSMHGLEIDEYENNSYYLDDEENGYQEPEEDEYFCKCRFCHITRNILHYMVPNAYKYN